MFHRVLIRKYIGQSAVLFLACGLALFAFAWVRVWVVSLLDMGQFQTILEQFREFEKFAPIDFDALFTYPGRVGMTYDEPIVIFCTVIWCVARGSDVVSGELGRGTLEMTLAQPVSRTSLLFSHAAVSVIGLVFLCLLVWAGVAMGVHFTSVTESVAPPTFRLPFVNLDIPLATAAPKEITVSLSERVDVRTYAASTFHLFSFGFFLLGIASFLSSIDRYRWRTVGAVVTIYVSQLVMYGLGKAAESLQWLLSFSFFSCYKPQKMTSLVGQEGFAAPWSLAVQLPDAVLPPLAYPMILLILGLSFYLLAWFCFTRRDLPAPL